MNYVIWIDDNSGFYDKAIRFAGEIVNATDNSYAVLNNDEIIAVIGVNKISKFGLFMQTSEIVSVSRDETIDISDSLVLIRDMENANIVVKGSLKEVFSKHTVTYDKDTNIIFKIKTEETGYSYANTGVTYTFYHNYSVGTSFEDFVRIARKPSMSDYLTILIVNDTIVCLLDYESGEYTLVNGIEDNIDLFRYYKKAIFDFHEINIHNKDVSLVKLYKANGISSFIKTAVYSNISLEDIHALLQEKLDMGFDECEAMYNKAKENYKRDMFISTKMEGTFSLLEDYHVLLYQSNLVEHYFDVVPYFRKAVTSISIVKTVKRFVDALKVLPDNEADATMTAFLVIALQLTKFEDDFNIWGVFEILEANDMTYKETYKFHIALIFGNDLPNRIDNVNSVVSSMLTYLLTP